MHISTTNVSQTVADGVSITIAKKEKVAYRLSIGVFTLDIGKHLEKCER